MQLYNIQVAAMKAQDLLLYLFTIQESPFLFIKRFWRNARFAVQVVVVAELVLLQYLIHALAAFAAEIMLIVPDNGSTTFFPAMVASNSGYESFDLHGYLLCLQSSPQTSASFMTLIRREYDFYQVFGFGIAKGLKFRALESK
jgi:hypothetical protein